MMWGYAGFGFAGMIVFWGAVIWAITRAGNNTGVGRSIDQMDASRILEVRFARGEIDAEEFDARRRELSN